MLSTPLISCSIGDATVCAITSAEAPAKVAFTTTVGGAISGYSLIGSARTEIAPTSLRRIEMTPANIGLSMKKCEKRIGVFLQLLDFDRRCPAGLIAPRLRSCRAPALPFVRGARVAGHR